MNPTHKHLLTGVFIWLMASGLLQGQSIDIAHIGKGQAFKLTGGVSANFAYLNANGYTQNNPFTYILQGHLNFSFYQFSVPVRYSYSNRQSQFNYQLPFSLNRLSLHPKYKWITAHIGDVSMQLSPYTLNGHQFTGAGIEINHPGGIGFSFMGGRLLKAVEDNGLQNQVPSFKRMGYGGKIGYKKEKYDVTITAFYAKDDIHSLQSVPEEKKVLPKENLTLSIESKLKLVKDLNIDILYAESALTQDLRARPADESSNISSLFIQSRSTTETYAAFKVALNYKIAGNVLSVGYEHIDPGYQTLGAYYFNNDLENITLNASRPFFNRKMNLTFNIGYQRDNLNNKKFMSSNRMVGSVNLQLQATKKINITGSYSNFTTHTNRPLNALDQINTIDPIDIEYLKYRQLSQNANLNMNWNISKSEALSQNINFNYSLASTTNEQGGIIAPGQQSNFHNAMSSYNLNFSKQKMSITTSLNYTYNDMDINSSKGLGGSISVNKRLMDNKLSTGMAISYNNNDNQGIQTDILNVRARASFAISKHQFSLNLVNMYKKTDEINGLNQFRMNFSYSYTFDALKKKEDTQIKQEKKRFEKKRKKEKEEKKNETPMEKKSNDKNEISKKVLYSYINAGVKSLYKDALSSDPKITEEFKIYESHLNLSKLTEKQNEEYKKKKEVYDRHKWIMNKLASLGNKSEKDKLFEDFLKKNEKQLRQIYKEKKSKKEAGKFLEIEFLKYLNQLYDKESGN